MDHSFIMHGEEGLVTFLCLDGMCSQQLKISVITVISIILYLATILHGNKVWFHHCLQNSRFVQIIL